MPRYRANVRFGSWKAGDEFESEDQLHADMAANGNLLSEVAQGEKSAKAAPQKEKAPEPEPQKEG
jgi:hypothetical protein